MKFEAATAARLARRALPTGLSSAELSGLGADILERAVFSAKTTSGHYLEEMEKRVRRILEPTTEQREDGSRFTAGLDRASARLELKEVWQGLGYKAEPGKEGTLEDLASDQRIDLVVRMNVESAQGFGQWREGQTEGVLEEWPAQELFRAEEREEPRDWEARWLSAAGEAGDEGAAAALRRHGRMAARKDSGVWEKLSAFGTPYPPFDFNSGMWVRDVERGEAVEMGLIDETTVIVPQRRGFEMEG